MSVTYRKSSAQFLLQYIWEVVVDGRELGDSWALGENFTDVLVQSSFVLAYKGTKCTYKSVTPLLI